MPACAIPSGPQVSGNTPMRSDSPGGWTGVRSWVTPTRKELLCSFSLVFFTPPGASNTELLLPEHQRNPDCYLQSPHKLLVGIPALFRKSVRNKEEAAIPAAGPLAQEPTRRKTTVPACGAILHVARLEVSRPITVWACPLSPWPLGPHDPLGPHPPCGHQ